MTFLRMAGFKRADKFLRIFGDLLYTKAQQVQLVRRYMARRSSQRHNTPYSLQDWQDFEACRALNRNTRRESSEAIRRAALARAEDMVRA